MRRTDSWSHRQTRFDKIPLLSGHGPPVERRQPDVVLFFAATNVSVIDIGQIAAQQGESKTMTTEFRAGTAQLGLMPLNTKRPEQLRTSIAR